jgi:hypothetical protein
MAVSLRRRGLAAAASATLALVLAVAIAGRGCRADDDTPLGAAREFVDAVRTGNRDAVLEALGPETRRRLERAAERAGEYVGSARRFAAQDLLSLRGGGWESPRRTYRLRERSEDQALVEVASADGQRGFLRVVRSGGHWKVELR